MGINHRMSTPSVLQARQVWNERLNGAFWGVLTQVDFVDGGVLGPRRVTEWSSCHYC